MTTNNNGGKDNEIAVRPSIAERLAALHSRSTDAVLLEALNELDRQKPGQERDWARAQIIKELERRHPVAGEAVQAAFEAAEETGEDVDYVAVLTLAVATQLKDAKRARLRKELDEAEAELQTVRTTIENTPRNPGTSSLRGKQHNIRVDAAIRRTAAAFAQEKALVAKVKGLQRQIAEAELPPVTPQAIRTATHVRTRWGWHEVKRVNKRTVSVVGGDLVRFNAILEVR